MPLTPTTRPTATQPASTEAAAIKRAGPGFGATAIRATAGSRRQARWPGRGRRHGTERPITDAGLHAGNHLSSTSGTGTSLIDSGILNWRTTAAFIVFAMVPFLAVASMGTLTMSRIPALFGSTLHAGSAFPPP
ncbi:hypothetical protein [Azospirillum brasilense]|uniref:hypothetical protein n=1 Tax=Azospirillum brasilense TaxID=192 RepID=UPI00190BBCD1|nr:hypothetical protein [Azospirillum brasilense]